MVDRDFMEKAAKQHNKYVGVFTDSGTMMALE